MLGHPPRLEGYHTDSGSLLSSCRDSQLMLGPLHMKQMSVASCACSGLKAEFWPMTTASFHSFVQLKGTHLAPRSDSPPHQLDG